MDASVKLHLNHSQTQLDLFSLAKMSMSKHGDVLVHVKSVSKFQYFHTKMLYILSCLVLSTPPSFKADKDGGMEGWMEDGAWSSAIRHEFKQLHMSIKMFENEFFSPAFGSMSLSFSRSIFLRTSAKFVLNSYEYVGISNGEPKYTQARLNECPSLPAGTAELQSNRSSCKCK